MPALAKPETKWLRKLDMYRCRVSPFAVQPTPVIDTMIGCLLGFSATLCEAGCKSGANNQNIRA